ncbi:hypothetical protein ACFWHR_14320 [Leucobacter sp. NPDC058333]|uniref:hypothetical protein n=1 Tax=Leucobacter sp. NPDC058333 TaxID=3346450 RepID=UPI0036658FCA
MSTSIYYSAARATPLSGEERSRVDALVQQRNDDFPFAYEGLDFYAADADSPETVLEGSTKLSADDDAIEALLYWCDALTELRRLVPDAEWHVHMDDFDIPWTDEDGYRLPGME